MANAFFKMSRSRSTRCSSNSSSRTRASRDVAAGPHCASCSRFQRYSRLVLDKPSRSIHPGDLLTFAQKGRVTSLRIEALGERRGPPEEARALYALLDQDLGTNSPSM